VDTPEKARELWRNQKLKYDNGGHIVFAFATGSTGGILGCSDDGEPAGTAGRPTLEVVKNCGITNLIITTARWYGGIKLGTGGLVKAYTEAAQFALENAQTFPGMFVDEAADGLSFRSHNGLLIMGGGSHRTGKPGGGWEELERAAEAYFPGASIRSRWATQDCMSLDGIPYIGRYSPRTADIFVATGFNKWGMTTSMVAANILTDMVLNRHNPYTELFSPSRSILHRQLAINTFEAITNLLNFGKKRCPHMGCALKWNPQEHTWDCPCHGSRFEENGELIDNPATTDLNS
jgi:hypothetical protein